MILRKSLSLLLIVLLCVACGSKKKTQEVNSNSQEDTMELREPLPANEMRTFRGRPAVTIPIDSMTMSDPAIFADDDTGMYYMTGTGGAMWRSKDLYMWEGPFQVVEIDSTSWMGKNPMIWAAEFHKYHNKYYYFATFTNRHEIIDVVAKTKIPRRASQVLVADYIEGPYTLINDNVLLPANEPSLDGTFFVDELDAPYMIYCHEWLQNWNGTVQIIRMTDDLSKMMGDPYIMFTAKDCPWSVGKDSLGHKTFNQVTDGPYLFWTGTGRLGMIWSTWIDNTYTLGAVYSQTATLNGPWVHEPEPLLKDNYGHGMIFETFEGKTLMSLHHQETINGKQGPRKPVLMEIDLSGDKLKIIGKYNPKQQTN